MNHCADLFMRTNRLYQPPVLQQRRLVLDVIAGSPCLDLIAESLKFLDFSFELILELILLCWVVGLLDLFVNGLEFGDTFRNFLEALVDFLC